MTQITARLHKRNNLLMQFSEIILLFFPLKRLLCIWLYLTAVQIGRELQNKLTQNWMKGKVMKQ